VRVITAAVVSFIMAEEPLNVSPETSSTDNLPDPDLKIILLGDSAVGKSKSVLSAASSDRHCSSAHHLVVHLLLVAECRLIERFLMND
jgi:hypothetical protein